MRSEGAGGTRRFLHRASNSSPATCICRSRCLYSPKSSARPAFSFCLSRLKRRQRTNSSMSPCRLCRRPSTAPPASHPRLQAAGRRSPPWTAGRCRPIGLLERRRRICFAGVSTGLPMGRRGSGRTVAAAVPSRPPQGRRSRPSWPPSRTSLHRAGSSCLPSRPSFAVAGYLQLRACHPCGQFLLGNLPVAIRVDVNQHFLPELRVAAFVTQVGATVCLLGFDVAA